MGPVSGVDQLLDRARLLLERADAHRANAILAEGGLLIDIRPAAQRAAFGRVPGALIVERNDLEWRLDPAGSHRLPEAGADRTVVIMCQEGYASSLAAASLVTMGRHRTTDLDGGFAAWQAAGYPTLL